MEGRRQNGKEKKVYYLLSTYQVPKVLLNYSIHLSNDPYNSCAR